MSVTCKECVCFPVCDECAYRGFNAESCPNFRRSRAQWIVDEGGKWAECSGCHESEKIGEREHMNYCGCCGAQMV